MISVIIPVYNEANQIAATVATIRKNDHQGFISEIIVSDGGSTDNTVQIAESAGAKVVMSTRKGRAAQMNFGAGNATQQLLYFIHADTVPSPGFSGQIVDAVDGGADAGCFMLSFDYDHWYLKTLCWFTRFDIDVLRFGDQSLFVKANLFKAAHGFREDHIVMEDQEFIKRIRKQAKFRIIRKAVRTSARKYLENGIFRTQNIFFLIFFMYQLGYPQQKLLTTYRRLLKQDKL